MTQIKLNEQNRDSFDDRVEFILELYINHYIKYMQLFECHS